MNPDIAVSIAQEAVLQSGDLRAEMTTERMAKILGLAIRRAYDLGYSEGIDHCISKVEQTMREAR